MFVPQAVHEKAAGGQGRAGLFAVAGRQNIGNLTWRELAAADIDERARNRADHIVQKAVAAHPDTDEVIDLVHIAPENRAHRALDRRALTADRRKIVRADKALRTLMHSLCIERIVVAVRISRMKRIAQRGRKDVIGVFLSGAVKTRVKVLRDFGCA